MSIEIEGRELLAIRARAARSQDGQHQSLRQTEADRHALVREVYRLRSERDALKAEVERLRAERDALKAALDQRDADLAALVGVDPSADWGDILDSTRQAIDAVPPHPATTGSHP